MPISSEELHGALAAAHYDLYKEVHNIRPRWYRYDEMSTVELEKAVQSLQEQAEEAAREEAAFDARQELSARLEAEEDAQEAIRRHEERWMDRAATMGAAGW